MNIEQRYDLAILKAKILGVAANLNSDKQYSREAAVEDLVEIVDVQLEGFIYNKPNSPSK
ncbi:hypothetical protein [Oceanobacillus sp. CF4.6]|uniref:hypothetical protein n=1 Tax=Oceanobacillus sp. CF4.6 TaxID=3373080 RepID=UPI003EE55BBD